MTDAGDAADCQPRNVAAVAEIAQTADCRHLCAVQTASCVDVNTVDVAAVEDTVAGWC